jgi:hypothetical protein
MPRSRAATVSTYDCPPSDRACSPFCPPGGATPTPRSRRRAALGQAGRVPRSTDSPAALARCVRTGRRSLAAAIVVWGHRVKYRLAEIEMLAVEVAARQVLRHECRADKVPGQFHSLNVDEADAHRHRRRHAETVKRFCVDAGVLYDDCFDVRQFDKIVLATPRDGAFDGLHRA